MSKFKLFDEAQQPNLDHKTIGSVDPLEQLLGTTIVLAVLALAILLRSL